MNHAEQLRALADAAQQAYGHMPPHQFPGPPTAIVERLNAIADAIGDERRGDAYRVYGSLHRLHMSAMRAGEEKMRTRIFDAIELMRELYPDHTGQWEADFAPKKEGRDG